MSEAREPVVSDEARELIRSVMHWSLCVGGSQNNSVGAQAEMLKQESAAVRALESHIAALESRARKAEEENAELKAEVNRYEEEQAILPEDMSLAEYVKQLLQDASHLEGAGIALELQVESLRTQLSESQKEARRRERSAIDSMIDGFIHGHHTFDGFIHGHHTAGVARAWRDERYPETP